MGEMENDLKQSVSSLLRLCALIVFLSIVGFAQSPTVEKIDPPNWWTGMTINPVRVLLRGTGLTNASVLVPQVSGLRAGNLKWSENGHYLFFDLTIGPTAKQGRHILKISKPTGSADARPFR